MEQLTVNDIAKLDDGVFDVIVTRLDESEWLNALSRRQKMTLAAELTEAAVDVIRAHHEGELKSSTRAEAAKKAWETRRNKATGTDNVSEGTTEAATLTPRPPRRRAAPSAAAEPPPPPDEPAAAAAVASAQEATKNLPPPPLPPMPTVSAGQPAAPSLPFGATQP